MMATLSPRREDTLTILMMRKCLDITASGDRHTLSSNPQRAAQKEEVAEAMFSLVLPANLF